MSLKKIFLENIGIKILALIISVVLWLFAKGYLAKLQ